MKRSYEQHAAKNQHNNTLQEKALSYWYILLPLALLLVLTFFVYLPSLHYPFQFDDIANISKKFSLRYDTPIDRWWTHSRWISDWLCSLNFQVGRFDPFCYRLTNVGIHLLSGILVFFLTFNLCRFARRESFFEHYTLLITTITTGLFLLHPVQTQTVSYVIQARQEGLATLFVLAILVFFIQAIKSSLLSMKIINVGLTVFFSLMACSAKEMVIITPFLLLLLVWFFIADRSWQVFKKYVVMASALSVVFFLVFFHYHSFSFIKNIITLNVPPAFNNRGSIVTLDPFDQITSSAFLMSQFKVVVHYLRILLVPLGMSVEYDWKLPTSFFSFEVLMPLALLLGIFAGIILLMVRKKDFYVSFGLLWFFICIAPRSSVIPSAEIGVDYKTYLASVGIYFMLAVVIAKILVTYYDKLKNMVWLSSLEKTVGLQALSVLLVVPLSFASYARNTVWSSAVVFWADNIKKAPHKARSYNNYGVALAEVNRHEEAIQAYSKAIELDSWYQDPLSNIAVSYTLTGNIDAAIKSLQVALTISDDYPEAYNNLGSLFIQKQDYAAAEQALLRAVHLRPHYGKAFFNLARMAETQGDSQKVYEYLKKATQSDLDNADTFYKFGLICLRLNKEVEAEQAFLRVIKEGLTNNDVYFNLGNAFYLNKKYEQAKNTFQSLIHKDPFDVRYVHNLAEVHFATKDYDKALYFYRRAVTLPQPLSRSFIRISTCLEQLKKVDEARTFLQELLALNIPDSFKGEINREMARLTIQQKLDKTGGKIGLNEMNKILAQVKEPNTLQG